MRAGWYVGAQANISEFIKEWNKLESFIGYNSHGQFISFGIDETTTTNSWRRIRHSNEIYGTIRRTAGLQRENVVSGICDWNPDFEKWRNKTIQLSDADAINKYKGRRKEGEPVESKILVLDTDLNWVIAKKGKSPARGLLLVNYLIK